MLYFLFFIWWAGCPAHLHSDWASIPTFRNRSGTKPNPNSPAWSESIHSPLHAKKEKTMNGEILYCDEWCTY